MKTLNRNDEGFALIITISLMAFLVLLLVTLTTMTRVETQLANNSQQMHIARENARMALGVAVGQLQRYAGVDEVVTARADIEGVAAANEYNPYWTGVWDDAGGNPRLLTWLVSGNEDPDAADHFQPTDYDYDPQQPEPYETPASPPAPDAPGADPGSGAGVRLVGRGTGFVDPDATPAYSIKGGVVAPLVPIHASLDTYPGVPGTPVVGHFAYWVADQGVKASIAKTERHLEANMGAEFTDPWYYGEPEDEPRQRLRQLLPQRFGQTPIFSNLTTVENDPVYKDRLLQVQSFHHLRQALRDRSPLLKYEDENQDDALRTHFHDITHFNLGVLASTGGHGLKSDLSVPLPSTLTGARPVGIDEFMKVGERPLTGGNRLRPPYDVRPPNPDSPSDNQPLLTIAPVITEMLFKYSVWADAMRTLQVRLDAEIELWNPYNADLKNEYLFVVLRDFSNEEPLVMVHHDDEPVGELSTVKSGVAAVGFNSGAMAPGVIQTIQVVVDMPALDNQHGDVMVLDPAEPGDPDELSLERAVPFEELQVELWKGPGPVFVEASSERLSTYELSDFDDFLTEPYNKDDESPKFGFYLRMHDASDTEEWLTQFDPRGIVLVDQDDADPDADRDPFENWPDVEDAVFLSLNAGSDILRPGPGNNVILFELPRQDVVNLGSLQHVHFHRNGAYALGNPWGDTAINSIFDRYFISTIPQDPALITDVLEEFRFPVPHTGMIPYRGNGNDPYDLTVSARAQLQSVESSRHLLLRGAFNINSTSEHAWRSVLASLNIVQDPDYPTVPDSDWEYGNGSTIALNNAVFRFSQTAHTNDKLVTRPFSRLADRDVAWVQGVRAELETTDLNRLAREIVRLLRERGRPFQTLSEFVTSGLLQKAIDTVDLNGTIPRYSPAFITQADIITLLAPFMLARSDTFLVRAYGDSRNPVTDSIEGRAWCEAIVQRVPTPFDPNDNDPSAPDRFVRPDSDLGRKFEIIYFRWLDPSEL